MSAAQSLLDKLRGKSLQAQFNALDAASRARALTDLESLTLERVVRELDRRVAQRARRA